MDAALPSSRDYSPKRRSQRIMLKTPVVVMARRENESVEEPTRTEIVNAHGALVVTQQKLKVGQMLTLCNSRTTEKAPCRVVYLGPNQGQKQQVGIEFMGEPRPHFWMISFPPADWPRVQK